MSIWQHLHEAGFVLFWTGDVKSIANAVRASREAYPKLTAPEASDQDIRRALHEFESRLVVDAVPTPDIAYGLPRALENTEELRAKTRELLKSSLALEQEALSSWRETAEQLWANYDEEQRHASHYFAQLRKTVLATALWLSLGAWLLSIDHLTWATAVAAFLLGGACFLGLAHGLRRSPSRHRRVLRHRFMLVLTTTILLTVSPYPLTVLALTAVGPDIQVLDWRPLPQKRKAETLDANVVSSKSMFPVTLGDGPAATQTLRTSRAVARIRVDAPYSDAARVLAVEYAPSRTELLQPAKFQLLNAQGVEALKAVTTPEENKFSAPFPRRSGNASQRRRRVNDSAFLGVLVENVSGEAIGPGRVFLFSPETRHHLGANGPAVAQMPRINPGEGSVLLLRTKPAKEKQLSRDQLRFRVEVETINGTLLDTFMPESALTVSPSERQYVGSLTIGEIRELGVSRSNKRHVNPWSFLMVPWLSTEPRVAFNRFAAHPVRGDSYIDVASSEPTSVRSQVRYWGGNPTRRPEPSDFDLYFTSDLPLVTEGELRLLNGANEIVATLTVSVTLL